MMTQVVYLLALLLSSLSAPPENSIGTIANSSGAAVLLHGDKVLPPVAGTLFYMNDILRTENGGLLRLVLQDGSSILVSENTELRVVLYDAVAQKTVVEMLHGRVRADVATITKSGGGFFIRTPTASVLALGTSLLVNTENANGSQVVDQRTITDLPMNRDPALLQMLGLTPGSGANGGNSPTDGEIAKAAANQIKITLHTTTSSTTPENVIHTLGQLTPGVMPFNFTGPTLANYLNVGATRVVALDNLVAVSNFDPKIQGQKLLFPGQQSMLLRGQPPGGVTSITDGNAVNLSQVFGNAPQDFGYDGRPCQAVLVINGQAVGGGAANFHFKITGMGTSTGHALLLQVTNDGPCPVYFLVPAGTIFHPKGFAEHVAMSLIFGSVPKLKDFQKMLGRGIYIVIYPRKAVAAGPAAPSEGEVSVPLQSYCVELHKLAPHPKTEYRFGDASDQEHLGNNLDVLERAHWLFQTQQLKVPQGHSFDSIIQWSLWTKIEGLDEKKFQEEFLKLVHKNYDAQKKKWDKSTEKEMEGFGRTLWQSVQTVLTSKL